MGSALMLLFFVTIGAGAGSLSALAGTGVLAAFIFVLLALHLAVTLVGARLLGLDVASVLVASNAAAGGPGTACALAAGRGALPFACTLAPPRLLHSRPWSALEAIQTGADVL